MSEKSRTPRMTRRDFAKLTAALGASALVAGCVPPPAATVAEEQNFRIGAAKELLGLDPVQQNDADSQFVYGQIHDTVAVLDLAFDVKPHLAESWKVSDDGLVYTYTFRKDVKFHDGSELTADDVTFTIDRILANKYPEGRKLEKIDMIDSYKKLDDHTVEITLKFPYAPFAAAWGNMHIVPKAAVERMGDEEFTKNPVGCGPFKFVEWVPNDRVKLVRFDDYWLVRPNLANFTIRPIPENAVAVANLIAGDVDAITDIVGANLKQLQNAADQGVVVLNKPSMTYFFAGFRMLDQVFSDLRFRQAVYMATDFDGAVKAIFPSEIAVRAYGCVPPGLWPQDGEYLKANAYPYDPDKAKALFQELMDEGVMPKDYKVTVAPPPDDARVRIAEVIVTSLNALGINTELWRGDWTAYTNLLLADEPSVIYMLGTVPAIPDPDANIRWLFSQESAHGRYLDIAQFDEYAGWDAEIKKAQVSASKDERTQIYRDMQRTMMQNVFHIPLYFKNAVMAKRDYVKDLDVNPLFQWDICKPWVNVSIEKKA